MPLRERFVHSCDDLLIRENLIDVLHPSFTKITHLFSD